MADMKIAGEAAAIEVAKLEVEAEKIVTSDNAKSDKIDENEKLAKDLYDRFLRKKSLLNMLMSEGYMNKKEVVPIEKQIDSALTDLEEIIRTAPPEKAIG